MIDSVLHTCACRGNYSTCVGCSVGFANNGIWCDQVVCGLGSFKTILNGEDHVSHSVELGERYLESGVVCAMDELASTLSKYYGMLHSNSCV